MTDAGAAVRGWLAVVIVAFGLAFTISSWMEEGSWPSNAVKATALGRPWANFNDPAPTLAAARRLRDEPGSPLYEGVHIVGASFLYPPLSAWLYRPLLALEDPELGLMRFNQAAFLAIALMAGLLALPAGCAAAFGAAGAAICFYPLTRAVELNQASVLVTLSMGLALLAADRGRQFLAGFPLAVAVAIKPHLVLVLPIVWWQAPRTALGAIAGGSALLLVSLSVAGIHNHVTYITEILPALGNGYAFFPNQSWNGVLNRLVHDDIGRFVIAPDSNLVRAGTLALGLATIGAAVYVARRPSARPPSFLLGLAWLAVTLASPIAWEHHYGAALFLFAIWLRERVRRRSALEPWDLPVAVAWVLIANFYEVRQLEGAATLLASYLFAGAIVLGAAFASAWMSSSHPFTRSPDEKMTGCDSHSPSS
jgi:hypothetical protein